MSVSELARFDSSFVGHLKERRIEAVSGAAARGKKDLAACLLAGFLAYVFGDGGHALGLAIGNEDEFGDRTAVFDVDIVYSEVTSALQLDVLA